MLCKYSCLLTIQDISIIFHHHWYIYSITIIPSPTNTFRRKVCVMVNWTLRNEYHIDILFTILCVYNVEFPTAWSGISFMRQNMNINRKRNEKWYQGKFSQIFLFLSIAYQPIENFIHIQIHIWILVKKIWCNDKTKLEYVF